MKKIILTILIIIPFSLNANENAKEKKVAKYVMENIQRDYVNCYSFYKVAAQSFKDAGKDKNIIDSLENSADVSLKYNYDLGEIMGLNPEVMSQMTKDKVNKFVKLAKKDFSSLAKEYVGPLGSRHVHIAGNLRLPQLQSYSCSAPMLSPAHNRTIGIGDSCVGLAAVSMGLLVLAFILSYYEIRLTADFVVGIIIVAFITAFALVPD